MSATFRVAKIDEAALRAEAKRVLERVRAILPPHAEVLEVGSAAVPGVIGKGDIDLLARAPESHFLALRNALDGVFMRNPDQLSNAQYQGYLVPSDFDVAIQCTVLGGPYDDFEAFLEVLCEDADERAAYNALKRAWDGLPMDEYRVAKGQFVTRVLAKRAALRGGLEASFVESDQK